VAITRILISNYYFKFMRECFIGTWSLENVNRLGTKKIKTEPVFTE
jgi:uncharacterized membrane protein YfhO